MNSQEDLELEERILSKELGGNVATLQSGKLVRGEEVDFHVLYLRLAKDSADLRLPLIINFLRLSLSDLFIHSVCHCASSS